MSWLILNDKLIVTIKRDTSKDEWLPTLECYYCPHKQQCKTDGYKCKGAMTDADRD